MSDSSRSSSTIWDEVLRELTVLVSEASKCAEFEEALNNLRHKGGLLADETAPEHKDRRHELFKLAIRYAGRQHLKTLMDNFNLSTLPEESSIPDESTNLLCLAVAYYDEPTFKYVSAYIDADQALRQLQPSKRSALHVAAATGKTDVFRILYEAKGDDIKRQILEARDDQEQTALHVAVLNRRIETIVELIRIQPELLEVQDANGETVFHKAVSTNKEILECLLASNASVLAQCDAEGNSPYRHFLERGSRKDFHDTMNQWDEDDEQEDIQQTQSFDDNVGSILVQAILTLENVSVLDKRKLLFKEALGPDLQCDLSIFSAENLDFHEYLDDLRKNRLNIRFYKTLIRVKLPDLSCSRNEKACAVTLASPVRQNPEANLVFKYLHRKGVRRVIEAVIPDCMAHPHSNRDIINVLNPMGVKRLNWRKLNLGVSTIQMAAPGVEDLTLYSSGDADALLQLSGPDGLCKLQKVTGPKHSKHPFIADTYGPAEKNSYYHFEDDDKELENLRKRCEDKLAPLKMEKLLVTLAKSVNADERKKDTAPALDHNRQTSILYKLSPFHELLNAHYGSYWGPKMPKDELIKVAILDSGVYANKLIFRNLTGGSFVEDTATADSHWHTVLNSHGTKMASLISEVNPYCHIYAARTHFGPDMHGGSVYSLSKALEWAMDQKVDIICISWTGPEQMSREDQADLEAMIQKASLNRLIFCATGDKGRAATELFPAGFAETFSISNCSIVGTHPEHTEIDNTQFLISAQDLAVKVPTYIKRDGEDTVGGSSAATAVAAGLASLVLSLVRFAYSGSKSPQQVSDREKQVMHFKSRSIMARVFKHMCGSTGNFVQPWKYLPRNLDEMALKLAKVEVQKFLDKAAK